jgi:hypothetical protein
MLFNIVVVTLEYKFIRVSARGADMVAYIAGRAIPESKGVTYITFDKRLNIFSGRSFREIQNRALNKALAAGITEVLPEPAESMFEAHKLLSTKKL